MLGKPGPTAPPTAREQDSRFRRGYPARDAHRPPPRWGFKIQKAETPQPRSPAFSAGALSGPYEGLEAEECGILDGCACDCFSGYRLDTTRMTCVGERRPGPACAGLGWKP